MLITILSPLKTLKKIQIIILCLICVSAYASAYNDQLIIDQYSSPYAGTALNLTLFHTYTFLDDQYLPSSEGKVTVPWASARIFKLYFENILSQLLMVDQHEIFGHGYRLREFGFHDISYFIGLTNGLTRGYGATRFYLSPFLELPYPKRAAIAAAGMEADAVISEKIRTNWIFENKVDRRDAWLYFVTSLDQANYIFRTSDFNTRDGNDVNSYVLQVNAWYGNNTLTKHKLRNYEYWELFDPSLYIGLYSVGDYLLKGTPFIPMTMLNCNCYRYMFSPRLLLAPYGPEFQLQNYLLTPKHRLWQVNLRYGNNSSIQSYGLDIFLRPIWRHKNWSFGNKLYLWYQPKFLKQNTAIGVKKGLGVGEFVAAEYQIYENLSAIGEFGYKTAGYNQGLPLGNSWVWRIGISLRY